jgi:hypothetical protein
VEGPFEATHVHPRVGDVEDIPAADAVDAGAKHGAGGGLDRGEQRFDPRQGKSHAKIAVPWRGGRFG